MTELNRLNVARAKAGQGLTGVEGNLAKMLLTDTLRKARETANRIVGPSAVLLGADDAVSNGVIAEMTMYSPAPAIYGGTDQVQRNIVGERGLGLPKEPNNDKITPFKDLLKS